MKRRMRQVLATVAGVIAGSAVNLGLVVLGGRLVPLPGGADASTPEGLQAAMALMGPEHFAFPFLAHALGTFAGALLATRLTPGRSGGPAGVIGAWFLLGGALNAWMLQAPAWFTALDLLLAYLPMAWLGHWLASRSGRNS